MARCEPGARAEYPMTRLLNLFQNSEIHGAHDFSDSQRLPVACRQGFERRLGFSVVFMGSRGFETDQLADGVAFLPLEDCLIGAADTCGDLLVGDRYELGLHRFRYPVECL